MKDLLGGFVTAFSMYSIVPMPQIEWNKSTMRYAFCFFPLIGVLIGAVVYWWSMLCLHFNVSPLLYSAVMVVIPLTLSGAIHLDGFIDTSDALYSRREIEKKLEILKDPHVGAFGVIACAVYFTLYFGASGELYSSIKPLMILCLAFPLERALSALSVVTFKMAKNTGLAHMFSSNADKSTVKIAMSVYISVITVTMLFLHFGIGLASLIVSGLWFMLYRHISYKQFGGITGDLAGYYIQIQELLMLIIAAIGGLIIK